MPSTRDNVAIFWDYENCQPASTGSGYSLVHNLRRLACNYGDVTLFKAYLEATPASIPRSLTLRSELQSSGVSLTDCPHNGRKDVADKMMLVDMLAFAIDNPTPSTVILVSGDRDFAYAVSVLRLRRYRVVIIAPPTIHISLKTQASVLFDWNRDILCRTEASHPLHSILPTASNCHHTKSPSNGKQRAVPPTNIADRPPVPQLDSFSMLVRNPLEVGTGICIPGDSEFTGALPSSPRPIANSAPPHRADGTRPSTAPSYFLVDDLPGEKEDISSTERVNSDSPPRPPVPNFKPLIDILLEQRDQGIPFPSWSFVAESLDHQEEALYAEAGVETFREYITIAANANIGIEIGGDDAVGEWIFLQRSALLSAAGSTSSAPSSTGMPCEESIPPGVIMTSNDTTESEDDGLEQYMQCTDFPGSPSGVSYIEEPKVTSQTSAPSSLPATGSITAECFDSLSQALLRQCTRGNTHPLRTQIAVELMKQDSQAYSRVGAARFKDYAALAVDASVVDIGGLAGDAWIALRGLAPFHPLVDLLHRIRQDGNHRPLRSAVGFALVGRRPNLYQDFGYNGFKQYISAAEVAGLVEVGGEGGYAWMSLRSY